MKVRITKPSNTIGWYDDKFIGKIFEVEQEKDSSLPRYIVINPEKQGLHKGFYWIWDTDCEVVDEKLSEKEKVFIARSISDKEKINQADLDNLADIIWWIKGYITGAKKNFSVCPFKEEHLESLRKARLNVYSDYQKEKVNEI